MAITYKKIREKIEHWGIDVTVRFTDIDVDVTKTFTFISQTILDKEYIDRMVKAISNIEDKIEEEKKPNVMDVNDRIEKHFSSNLTLSKADYLDMTIEEVTK